MTTVYGVLPQNVATDVNLSTSLKQYLYRQVALPYGTQAASLGLNNGYQMKVDGTWTTDNNGMLIFQGNGPTDPRLYERLPCISYQIDDAKGAKSPKSTGLGDAANFEYIPILLCCVPPPLVAEDGSSEPDILTQNVMRSILRNAITRAWHMPIVDHNGTKSAGLYPVTGYADIMDQRVTPMSNELKQMMVNKRERFDVTFTLRWPVTTTDG